MIVWVGSKKDILPSCALSASAMTTSRLSNHSPQHQWVTSQWVCTVGSGCVLLFPKVSLPDLCGPTSSSLTETILEVAALLPCLALCYRFPLSYFLVFTFPLISDPLSLPLWVLPSLWLSSPTLFSFHLFPTCSLWCIKSPCVSPVHCQVIFCLCN